MGIFYSLCHRAQARAEQPADGEEGGGDVDEEEGKGGNEDVQVELGRHPTALVPGAVHVAEHSHLVPSDVDQLLHFKVSDQLCLLLQVKVVPVHQLTDPAEGKVAGNDERAEAFKDGPDQVGLEEGGVVLEGLPHFYRVDRVLHTHFTRALLKNIIQFHLSNISLFRAESLRIFGASCEGRRCEMRLETGVRNAEKKSFNLELRRLTVVIGIQGRRMFSILPALSCL